ncbi:hypothetical protein B0H13DRAFT_2577806 [Mycena leptocephala]|nr:hypothetical protein B0H13DRAFT_2577806 [Mycena leptocephala]
MQLGGQERVGSPVIRPTSVVRARRRPSSPPRYPPTLLDYRVHAFRARWRNCIRLRIMRHWDHDAAQLSRRPTARTGIGHPASEKQIRGANAQVGMPLARPIMHAWCARALHVSQKRHVYAAADPVLSALPGLGRDRAHGYGHLIVHGTARLVAGPLQLRRGCGKIHSLLGACICAGSVPWADTREKKVETVNVVDKIEGRVHGSASSRGGELETGDSEMKWEVASEGGMKLFPSVGVAGLKYPFGRGAVRKARVRGVEHRGRVVDDHVAGACESRVGEDRAEGISTGRQREGGDGREVGVLRGSRGCNGKRARGEDAQSPRTRRRTSRSGRRRGRAGRKRRMYYTSRIWVTGFSASTHAAAQSVLPASLRISGQNGVRSARDKGCTRETPRNRRREREDVNFRTKFHSRVWTSKDRFKFKILAIGRSGSRHRRGAALGGPVDETDFDRNAECVVIRLVTVTLQTGTATATKAAVASRWPAIPTFLALCWLAYAVGTGFAWCLGRVYSCQTSTYVNRRVCAPPRKRDGRGIPFAQPGTEMDTTLGGLSFIILVRWGRLATERWKEYVTHDLINLVWLLGCSCTISIDFNGDNGMRSTAACSGAITVSAWPRNAPDFPLSVV